MIDLLRCNFHELESKKAPFVSLDALYVPVDVFFLNNATHKMRSRAEASLNRHQTPILKTHYLDQNLDNLRCVRADIAEWIDGSVKTINVVRNPCDVMASFLAFEKSFRVIKDQREWLNLSGANWVRHVTGWAGRQNCLTVRFEDILCDTSLVLDQLEVFLQCERETLVRLPPKFRSRWDARLARVKINSLCTEIYVTGDSTPLADCFNDSDLNEFKDIVGPTAKKLGYDSI